MDQINQSCIFCKIASGQAPSEKEFENEKVIAFRDINPKTTTHILIVPKKHIHSISSLEETDKTIISELIFCAKQLATTHGLDENGYRLTFNVGQHGGQEVDHIHLHLLGGQRLGSMI